MANDAGLLSSCLLAGSNHALMQTWAELGFDLRTPLTMDHLEFDIPTVLLGAKAGAAAITEVSRRRKLGRVAG